MSGFLKLLSFVKPYRGLVYLNILCNLLMAIFTVVSIPAIIPFFSILFGLESSVEEKPTGLGIFDILDHLKYYFSRLIEDQGAQTALIYTCLFIVIIFFFKNFFRYLSMFFIAPVRNGTIRDLRSSLLNTILVLPIGFFTEERKGDILSRMSSDVSEIEFSILSMLEIMFREPLIILGSIMFMLIISPTLTVFVFVLILFTAFIIGGVSRALKKKSYLAQSRLGDLISIVEESLSGLRIIKAFRAERFQLDRFKAENNEYKNLLNRILWRRDLSSPLSEFLGVTVVAVLMWYGSSLVFSNQVDPHDFIAFLLAFYYIINPAKAFSNAYYNLQKGLAAVDRIEFILSATPEPYQEKSGLHIQEFQDSIKFENVYFKYQEDQDWVLSNINLTIEKGKSIALVGTSGAGKSTLVDLIPRFYEPSAGKLLLDNQSLSEYNLLDLRSLMGVVSQEAILFNDTIYNNIVFGAKNIKEEQVVEAAKIAFAHDFIMATERGYQTVIGDKGSKLSGGQRQRITIARAILSNPDILIFDEATSALDSESESMVQKAITSLLSNRTVILIAHRLSTIQDVDEIIVLKEGQIVERGNHHSLIKMNGEYVKFLELQAL